MRIKCNQIKKQRYTSRQQIDTLTLDLCDAEVGANHPNREEGAAMMAGAAVMGGLFGLRQRLCGRCRECRGVSRRVWTSTVQREGTNKPSGEEEAVR
jgi:hypothetical protein